MKKYLTVTLIILTSHLLFAQDISIGCKAGISWSGINGRFDFKNFDQTQIKNRVGHNFGIKLNYGITSFLTLQIEMNYEEKGFDFQNDPWITGIAYKGNFKTKYISIPLILNLEIGKNVKYYGYAGCYLGFLLNVENYTSYSSTSSPDLKIYDMSYEPTEFNKYEFGGLFGLGAKIPLCGKVKLIIDSRYNFGLTKAAKNSDYNFNPNQWTKDTPNNFQNVYNRSLTISLGILYMLNDRKN